MSETFIRVKRIIIAVIGSAERDVNPSASLDELGIGSLDLLELGMALEEAFDVMIMDEYLLSSKTVGDLVETVQNARARQKCSSGAAVRQPQARTCARPALCWPFQISRFRMFQLPPKRSK